MDGIGDTVDIGDIGDLGDVGDVRVIWVILVVQVVKHIAIIGFCTGHLKLDLLVIHISTVCMFINFNCKAAIFRAVH